MKDFFKHPLTSILTILGVSALTAFLLTRNRTTGEKKSNLITPDLFGGGQGAANSLQFTMTNRSDSPQKITLFNANSLTSINNQNSNVSISSTPDLQYFTQTLSKQPQKLIRVDIRSDNVQQLTQTFNVQAKNANGKQVNISVLPMQSVMQVQSNFATADLNGLTLDLQTRIKNYTVLPKTSVTMIVYWQ